ncbi:uncharacterized protein BYT42DRAFT_570984 [Radiomyces spectabilis]|uniref:uncharacterized protein n=1 Tax=Radiomyces spectabilis TaxID=64574 RepID=UPI00221E9F34|nr:uncharacterized protein BYT42DRAFT_570984 [Radiomyces spectabilis]KAI8377617.1 hypothetical protein BYT42DRAFT_570984 [Radiomyces spectabilis]
MLPRLPPLLLAALGGASIYGIKWVLDKMEPKALGPPGSSEHAERVYKYRQNVRRVGMAAAASGIVYGAYWLYESRVHRPTPAVSSETTDGNDTFYNDQYSSRERRFREESEKMKAKQRQKEEELQRQLESEQALMSKTMDGPVISHDGDYPK